MEVGKLYKSLSDTNIIVKCLKIINDKYFFGSVYNDNEYYQKGMLHDGWYIENFEEYIEPVTSEQIGGNHYKKLKIQPTEFIHANEIPFIEGNIIKYVIRHRDKNGIEDLKKARHYIDLLIQFEYENTKKL